MKGTLFVLPNILSGDNLATLSLEALDYLEELRNFAVENPKNARRLIRALGIETDFSECQFLSIHHKTDPTELQSNIEQAIGLLLNGESVGILSDAGMAGIADPGSKLVAEAQRHKIPVKPVVGPSSMFLALAASGLNGQKFTFHGYLPIEERHRRADLKAMEAEVQRSKASQLFMETPYRNNKLMTTICESLKPETLLCVACDITSEKEFILTQPISHWRKQKHDLNKRPAIFIIGDLS